MARRRRGVAVALGAFPSACAEPVLMLDMASDQAGVAAHPATLVCAP